MNHLFLGMLFVLLDFNLSFGRCTLGLLPDFVGYILILKGLESLSAASGKFAKAKPWALVMAVYTGVLYISDLLSLSFRLRLLAWGLGLASTAAGLAISYWIVTGVQEIERIQSRDLQGQKLKLMWIYMAVISGICYVCNWIPIVGVIAAAGSLVIGICFLVAFYKTKTLYEDGGI